MERKIEDVVETLKAAKVRQNKCTLLIGAGCSVKAGVPTAAGFVEAIKAKYPQAFGRASKKTYASCMAELAVSERRDLIADYVDKAKINWAHIGVAQLIKYGYVDRVLTTNFDLLVARACALVGLFPAVYDFATSQLYKPADITDEAIIHLHGQRTGFVLMNTEEECKRHSKLMKPVFQDAGLGRVWLVVGYSGNNDPVFDHLAKTSRFDNNLYWVGYLDNEPPLHVEERLLRPSKDAYFVRGYDADDFFVRISQELRIFPPDFAARPFSHLDSLLATVAPYKIPGEDANVDVTAEARRLIQTAINQHEQAPEDETPTVLKASRELLARNYDGVIAQLSKGSESSPELQSVLGWAYLLSGNALSGQAETKSGSEADDLFRLAGEKYGAAKGLKIKPDKH